MCLGVLHLLKIASFWQIQSTMRYASAAFNVLSESDCSSWLFICFTGTKREINEKETTIKKAVKRKKTKGKQFCSL